MSLNLQDVNLTFWVNSEVFECNINLMKHQESLTELSLKNGLSLSTDSMLHKLYNYKMYINMSSVGVKLFATSTRPNSTPSRAEASLIEIGRIETALNVTFYDKEPSSEMDYVKQIQHLKTQDRANKRLNFLWNSVEQGIYLQGLAYSHLQRILKKMSYLKSK
jgi:hypothetical protein